MQNALETGFALKCAIAKGPLTFDNGSGIYFGRSIIDAYLLEEELKFYGVVFHHSVEELIQQYKDIPPIRGKREQKIPVSEYQIHLKSGRSTHYCILYHKLTKVLSGGGTILQHWKSILNFLAGQSLVVLKYIY